MDTIKRNKAQLSVAAVAALAIFAVAAVMLLAGGSPTQAQGTGGNANSDTLNEWDNPQPCGPGAGTAFMAEPHELHSGHYALFEGYWRTTSRGLGDDAAGVGELHMNECPPKMVTTDERGTVTVTRTKSKMDIEEAILHVKDVHKVGVVATNAEATDGQLSLEEYPEVRRGLGLAEDAPVLPGTQVWWLRLDDPDTGTETNPMDETSALGVGFSTKRFDSKYWHRVDEDGNTLKPMRYKLEVRSYPADPDEPEDVPHFFTYRAPKSGNARAELVWDGFKPGDEETDMKMDPDEYEAVQWIFTKPGTYKLLVELQSHVRDAKNRPDGAGDDWKPISANDFETAAAQYTFHIGPKLAENEPPIFGVNLSVAENSPAGTKVGGPVPVYNADAETLYYDLDGDGEENFETVAGTDPHTVQIVVADGASLDYETGPSYQLSLTVTDRLNHEGDKDSPRVVIDDTLIVKIDLEDEEPGLNLQADRMDPAVGETVNLVARYEPTAQWSDETPYYQWAEKAGTTDHPVWHVISSAPNAPTWSVSQSSPVTKTYRVAVVHGEDYQTTFVNSNEVTISWKN